MPDLPSPYRALVVGASGGIGAAFVAALSARGVPVQAMSRRSIPAAAGVIASRIDITDEASIVAACATLGDGPPLRLVIVASGLLHGTGLEPEKSLRMLDADRLARSFAVNAIGPALVAKHVLPLMPRDGPCVFAAISARVGSLSDNKLGGWYGYRASKAALNQMIRTLAIEVARSRPETVVAALHPGTVQTGLSAPFRGNVPAGTLFSPEVAAGHLLRVIDGLTAADSGGFFAWDGSVIPF